MIPDARLLHINPRRDGGSSVEYVIAVNKKTQWCGSGHNGRNIIINKYIVVFFFMVGSAYKDAVRENYIQTASVSIYIYVIYYYYYYYYVGTVCTIANATLHPHYLRKRPIAELFNVNNADR